MVQRELTDEQWERIAPYLPRPPSSSNGGPKPKPSPDCFEGLLWVLLRTGARWKDMPDCFPSGSTCWRRLKRWDETGAWQRAWLAFVDQLGERDRQLWEVVFADAMFVPAKKGRSRRKNEARQGDEAGGGGQQPKCSSACTVASASPSATKLIEPTLDKLSGRPRRAVMDKEFDGDRFRDRIAARGIDPIIPYRYWAAERRYEDKRKLRRYENRWVVSSDCSPGWATSAASWCATNASRGCSKPLFTWLSCWSH